jgi:hypothetical protein
MSFTFSFTGFIGVFSSLTVGVSGFRKGAKANRTAAAFDFSSFVPNLKELYESGNFCDLGDKFACRNN